MVADKYNHRTTTVNVEGKSIPVNLVITSGTSMFVTNDLMFKTFTMKEVKPTSYDKTAKTLLPSDRFIYINEITSYLSTSTVVLYYDKQWNDIIITPSLSFVVNGINNNPYNVYCYTIGGQIAFSNDRSSTYPLTGVIEEDYVRLPETNENVDMKYYLAAVPGLAAPDVTQDTNTYNEKIGELITLNRYYKQVMSFINLGTYANLFKNPKIDDIPLGLLRNGSIRIFMYENLGHTKPKPDQNIYLSLPF